MVAPVLHELRGQLNGIPLHPVDAGAVPVDHGGQHVLQAVAELMEQGFHLCVSYFCTAKRKKIIRGGEGGDSWQMHYVEMSKASGGGCQSGVHKNIGLRPKIVCVWQRVFITTNMKNNLRMSGGPANAGERMGGGGAYQALPYT